jgi:thioredoxin reductase
MNVQAASGVSTLTQTKGEEISDKGLVISDADGHRQTIEADIIVLACGYAPNTGLLEELKGIVPEIHTVGDYVQPRTIMEAIADGARIGRTV